LVSCDVAAGRACGGAIAVDEVVGRSTLKAALIIGAVGAIRLTRKALLGLIAFHVCPSRTGSHALITGRPHPMEEVPVGTLGA
jgi:hypothetical protein